MLKHLVALIVTLQLLAGSAFAAKTVIVDGNPATRSPGTRVTGDYLNALNNHRHDGKNVDGSGILDYAADTGAANALVIALSPALTAQVEGMPIWVKVGHDNTGETTLKVNALTAAPLYKNVNEELEAGDIRAGQVVGVSWAGSAFQLINYQNQPPPPVTDASTLQGQTAAQLVPPGAVMAFAMPSVPSGWLLCDGRTVLRSQYPSLYAAIGTTWGAGDGVSTFALPDLRGEFIRGWDGSGIYARNVDEGRVFGSWQPDALQNLTGTFAVDDTQAATGTGIFYNAGASGLSISNDGSFTGGRIGFDASRVARTSTETRPRNVSLMYCIHQ